MAEQEERIYYEAAKEKAEAVIFTNEIETEEIEPQTISLSESYKICDSIEEVKGARGMFSTLRWSMIPAWMHRLADETDNFDEFKRKMLYEHPRDIEGEDQ